jgi:hypothetical protein
MRTGLTVFVALCLAGGLAFLLLATEPVGDEGVPAFDLHERELAENPHLLLKEGVLTIRVLTAEQTVPTGAEVGYRHDGKLRLVYARERGEREFSDAPLGRIEVVARAPGYAEATRVVEMVPGVPEVAVLTLEPEGRAPAPPPPEQGTPRGPDEGRASNEDR